MLQAEQLVKKVETLPSPLLQEVDLFVDYLLLRYRQQVNHTTADDEDDLDAATMTKVAMWSGAFDWLDDPAEDGIYSDADGEPV